MNRGYECEYCSSQLDDTDDVIFIDRSFLPSGAIFCDAECLMHFLGAYESNLEDIKPLIEADEKYPLTIPKEIIGGDRTEACSVVKNLADKNSWIDKY